jgi:hypothetical protein
MKEHEQRVVDEKADLDDRIARLGTFMLTDTFAQLPDDGRFLLFRQGIAMRDYSDILGKRIAAVAAQDAAEPQDDLYDAIYVTAEPQDDLYDAICGLYDAYAITAGAFHKLVKAHDNGVAVDAVAFKLHAFGHISNDALAAILRAMR